MGFKAKRKSAKYKQLIKMVAQSSGYYEYEVIDVLNHFVGNVQLLLSQGLPVKISGLGTMQVKNMKIKGIPSKMNPAAVYNAFRLSVVSDTALQNHLKEFYEDTSRIESE